MKKILKLLLLVAMMSLIYYLSDQPAADSTDTTNVFIVMIYKLYSSVFSFTNLISLEKFSDLFFQPIRKLAHFTEFMILGILVYINSKEYLKSKFVLFSIIISGLYAISDEVHQLFVLNRYCSVWDMLLDTSGATFGIILIHLVYKKWIKE